MDQVMPIIAICAVGLCAAVGYLLFVAVNALRKRFGKHGNVIEIDDDTLVVDLREYRRKKTQTLTSGVRYGTITLSVALTDKTYRLMRNVALKNKLVALIESRAQLG